MTLMPAASRSGDLRPSAATTSEAAICAPAGERNVRAAVSSAVKPVASAGASMVMEETLSALARSAAVSGPTGTM